MLTAPNVTPPANTARRPTDLVAPLTPSIQTGSPITKTVLAPQGDASFVKAAAGTNVTANKSQRPKTSIATTLGRYPSCGYAAATGVAVAPPVTTELTVPCPAVRLWIAGLAVASSLRTCIPVLPVLARCLVAVAAEEAPARWTPGVRRRRGLHDPGSNRSRK